MQAARFGTILTALTDPLLKEDSMRFLSWGGGGGGGGGEAGFLGYT